MTALPVTTFPGADPLSWFSSDVLVVIPFNLFNSFAVAVTRIPSKYNPLSTPLCASMYKLPEPEIFRLPETFNSFSVPTLVNEDDVTEGPKANSDKTSTPSILYTEPSGMFRPDAARVAHSSIFPLDPPLTLTISALDSLSDVVFVRTPSILPISSSSLTLLSLAAKEIPTPTPGDKAPSFVPTIDISVSTELLEASVFVMLAAFATIAPSVSYSTARSGTTLPGNAADK